MQISINMPTFKLFSDQISGGGAKVSEVGGKSLERWKTAQGWSPLPPSPVEESKVNGNLFEIMNI